jgi:hypothetical protein
MLSVLVRAELEHVLFCAQQNVEPLEVDKAEALVYIYMNSRLLHQRPGADPVRYYDDNIFLEDSDDDVEHSRRWMTMTMMTTMTKMVME